MDFLNFHAAKRLATFLAIVSLYVGSVMVVLPFVHAFDVVSIWVALGIVLGGGVLIMSLAVALIEISFMHINEVVTLDVRQYLCGSSILLGLLGAIWGGVVYIMGLLPNIAMFVGVVLLLINSLIFLWYHYVAFLKGKEAEQVAFRRHRFVIYLVIVVCLVIWLVV